MAPPALPKQVIEVLASQAMREHHAIWHYVRDRWHVMSAAERGRFEAAHWRPPRLNPNRWPEDVGTTPGRDPGSGLDFLFMHRRMIEQVNALLAQINDSLYPRVEGWNPVPWDHSDPEWPMPPNYPDGSPLAKDPTTTTRWRTRVSERYENPAWLGTVSLDELGAEIENGIHNWLHMHWAADPWFKGLPGQDENDPRNNYLGSTYSSHVNPAFWKLHGWIDDRIAQWESATGKPADFSGSWSGPSHMHAMAKGVSAHHTLLTPVERARSRTFFRNRLATANAF
ncbi:MAG: hypothetical protein ACREV5_22245 [Steroidobacter sp.]